MNENQTLTGNPDSVIIVESPAPQTPGGPEGLPQPLLEPVDLAGTRDADTLIGGAGDDTLRGGRGRDELIGNAGNDQIFGGKGDDSLSGGEGDDELNGGDENDTIEGGAGADTINGGSGVDTASYANSAEAVQIDLSRGSDSQSGGEAEGDVLISIENVTGSDFDDAITGTNGRNVIDGGAGDDTLDGKGGSDTINGGAGDDVIIAGNAGGRVFDGGAGDDTLRITSNDDLRDDDLSSVETLEIEAIASRDARVILQAGQEEGLDAISFDSDNDQSVEVQVVADDRFVVNLSDLELTGFGEGDNFRIVGDGDNEEIRATDIRDEILSGGGNDLIFARAGDDDVRAGNGNDVIFGEDGDDVLRGQDGNDLIGGGAGADRIEGGNGVDRVDYFASAEGVDIVLDNGARGGDGGDAAGDRLISIENVTGSAFDDLVRGSSAANTIDAGDGDDVVEGLRGADTLDGGAGDDDLSGGSGRDLLIGGAGDDTLSGGGDADTFQFAGSFGNDVIRDFQQDDVVAIGGIEGIESIFDLDVERIDVPFGNGASRTDTIIEFGDSRITLEGFDAALSETNFDFF